MLRTDAVPQPWCVRVWSCAVPENVCWLAVLTSNALAVAACGRDANTSRPLPGPPSNTPSAHIWNIRPALPQVIGVAPEVPPNDVVYAVSFVDVVVSMRS